MTSCGRRNIKKYRKIKNDEEYIILEISSKLDFLGKKEFTFSVSRDYTERPVRGLTTSLDTRTKSPNKKRKLRFSITDITNHNFSNFLNKFNNSPYLCCKSKQVHNEPNEA